MNKILGMSFLVMLVSGVNLLSMDRDRQAITRRSKEFNAAIEQAFIRGKDARSQGSRFGAVMALKYGEPVKKRETQKKEKQQDKLEDIFISLNKRKFDEEEKLESIKKAKQNDGSSLSKVSQPTINIGAIERRTIGRFNSAAVKKGMRHSSSENIPNGPRTFVTNLKTRPTK